MVNILSALKRYNANTRDASSPDCVKRALSMAYSMDYDEVSRELNRIKRELGASAFNILKVFMQFMKLRGDTFIQIKDSSITTEEFCEKHPSGVYLLLVSNKDTDSYPNHMSCVIDGDVYDSWNSLKTIVKYYCNVTGSSSEVHEDSMDDLMDALVEYVNSYTDVLKKKINDTYITLIGLSENPYTVYDSYTAWLYYKIGTKEIPKRCYRYSPNTVYLEQLTVKMNPRLTFEDNLELWKKKLKQKIYDAVYNMNKYILDVAASETLEVNPEYFGSRTALMQLPEWVRPLVVRYDTTARKDYYHFYLEIEALEDDPRSESAPYVTFRTDTLRELKYDLEEYRKRFRRQDYDY